MGSDIKGSHLAPVALVVFSNFECQYCGVLARTVLPGLEEEYVASGRLVIAFRQFPNESTHTSSVYAAETAVCAGQQGKFWSFHDNLFQPGLRLARASIDDAVGRLLLDPLLLDRCRTSEGILRVEADMSEAIALGLTGTPASFVGAIQENNAIHVTSRIDGAQGIAAFEEAINAALRATEGNKR
jgi:protein-disulfide isomerase